MPQLTNLVLTDRKTTPVAHTLIPVNIDKNGVAYVAESTGTPVADISLSISTRRVNDKIKSRLVLTVPVVQTETINGISKPKVVRSSVAAVDFTFSRESSEAERNDVVGMFADAFGTAKALVNDAIVKAQGIY